MKKILIAYFSSSGHTEKMAQYVAEGVRISGQQAVLKKVADIKTPADMEGYDGYIFGCPTFHLDIAGPMQKVLNLGRKKTLEGKLGGAFGAYKHEAGYGHNESAPKAIFDLIQKKYKMEPFDLGPFNLQEDEIDKTEGMRTCQDYGKVFGEKLGV